MLVYFDICAIQRPFDDHSQLRVRLEAEAVLTLIQLCETGLFELVISAAHEIENGQNPYPERRAYAADVLSLAQHRVTSGAEVAERTAAYVQGGLRRLDAFHLAAAVTFRCSLLLHHRRRLASARPGVEHKCYHCRITARPSPAT